MELLAHSRLQHISVSAHGSLVEPDTRCGLCGIPVNVSLNNKLSWNEESIFSCCCWCQLSYNRLSFTDLSTSFNAEKFCVNKIKPAHQMMFYLVSVQWKHNVRKPEWKCLRNLRDLFVEMNTVSLFKNNGLKQMSRFWKHGILWKMNYSTWHERGTKKTRQESYPWPPEYMAGALSTELRELMESKNI